MKRLPSLISISLLLLAAACKRDCEPPVMGVTIVYSGFAPGDADTLIIYNYAEGDYTQLIDSDMMTAYGGDTISLHQLNPQKGTEQLLRLQYSSHMDTLHDVVWEEVSCKARLSRNTYYLARGASLNGVPINDWEVIIRK